ncbi:MAG: MOSC domain-containing protein, partial [Chloroflexi bacterium]|nr:MOSC domain-containing protein [Chloroflexota bacterium]
GQAWDDFGWAGERLRIGETLVEVSAPLVRCKAVNASPEGGGRDINLLDVLDSEFGHLNFGVEANVLEGGVVRPGDPVSVLR